MNQTVFHTFWLISGNVQMLTDAQFCFLLERAANTYKNDLQLSTYELIKILIDLETLSKIWKIC